MRWVGLMWMWVGVLCVPAHVPGSKISGTRAGTHNTPTHIHLKPTHLIGGYGQLSYGFNYYGPTGNQRDSYVVVRRMEEVDWLED